MLIFAVRTHRNAREEAPRFRFDALKVLQTNRCVRAKIVRFAEPQDKQMHAKNRLLAVRGAPQSEALFCDELAIGERFARRPRAAGRGCFYRRST